jgi:large conductance mechanosensitive channel
MRDIKVIQEIERVRKIKLWEEFKSFAFKGNMIDLAVAFVVGAAFSGVVKSMVDNIFMPIIGYIPLSKSGYMGWHIGHVMVGKFLGDLINFLLIAFVVFIFVVKLMQTLVKRKDEPAPAEPTTKECPYCLSVIPIKANKCAHCTADLPAIETDVVQAVAAS